MIRFIIPFLLMLTASAMAQLVSGGLGNNGLSGGLGSPGLNGKQAGGAPAACGNGTIDAGAGCPLPMLGM